MGNSNQALKMNLSVFFNLSPEELIQQALDRGEGELASNGAFVAKTGARTGRSPKDRFIVKDATTEKTVAWNDTNQSIRPEQFSSLWLKADEWLQQKSHYVSDYQVGSHPKLHVSVKVITELAWHNLFASNLFIQPTNLHEQSTSLPAWTILHVPSFKADPLTDGVNSDAAVILNFTAKKILIVGTFYAGEIKKSMFSVLNFILPEFDTLPMHCAANEGQDGQTTLFFGLSGTGKTTLSADPERYLIGDDEHGWSEDGIFNFEGGCYAKCIDLVKEKEPLIWQAIRPGAVIENVVLHPQTKDPIYSDASLTQNTRAAYPLSFIPQRVHHSVSQAPSSVIFLCCDLYGVLPPVSKLTREQAAYYFLSGYTALVGSTEVGQGGGIKPTFSTCFGAPFFPRPASVYANLLLKRLDHHPAQVYLVNTGWTGGAHGQGGTRFSIPVTRSIIRAIVSNELIESTFECVPGFNVEVPTQLKGVDAHVLHPQKVWADQASYVTTANELIEKFRLNFEKFNVSDEIKNAGPKPI